MPVFFTADTHFGHATVLRSIPRPFASVSEMDEAMIRNWNETVGHEDTVVHGGDFAAHMPARDLRALFHRLNGRKILVVGNHDEEFDEVGLLPWSEPPTLRLDMTVEGATVVIQHYAAREWPRKAKGSIHLYGHSHGSIEDFGNSTDIGVDCWSYRPVTIAEVRRRIADRSRKSPRR